jgi:uncharacterized RDD family membrane protein YckC
MFDQIGNAGRPRIFGSIIDNLLATILGFVIVAVVKPQNQPLGGLIVCVVYLLYFFVFEAVWSRTPGKFLTGLEVRMTDGSAGSTRAAAIRTLARIVEVNPLLLGGLPAGIAILATKRKQRLGDLLAGTGVAGFQGLPARVRQSTPSPASSVCHAPKLQKQC